MSSDDLLPRAMSLAVHELRTPLTVVSGYLRMLIRGQAGPLTPQQQKMLTEAERSCGRLSSLVEEMSEFRKFESGESKLARQDLDIAALLAELASGMHEGEDRGVHIELRGTDRPIIVTGDRVRLAAAITALLHDAIRQRGEPGTLVVQCSTIEGDGYQYALVAIGDHSALPELTAHAANGSGAHRTFDEWRGGLGMALPLARRVIEGHGGALWSAESGHSASALRLPLRT